MARKKTNLEIRPIEDIGYMVLSNGQKKWLTRSEGSRVINEFASFKIPEVVKTLEGFITSGKIELFIISSELIIIPAVVPVK